MPPPERPSFSGSSENPALSPERAHKVYQDRIYEHFLNGRQINPPPIDTVFTTPTDFSIDTNRAYAFTNENLDFMESIDLQGKDVLTIGGSGDIAINSFMYGANSVTCVDVSLLACYLGELKAATQPKFRRREFLGFWTGPQPFSRNQYATVRSDLSYHARDYLDKLITTTGTSDLLRPSKMIIAGHGDIETINPYLQSDEHYSAAQQNAKPVTFYPQPMDQFLNQNWNHRYHEVNLSNIFSYPPYIGITPSTGNMRPLMGEVQNTLRSASGLLNTGGTITCYEHSRRPDFARKTNVKTGDLFVQGTGGMTYETIEGDHPGVANSRSSVLIITKNN